MENKIKISIGLFIETLNTLAKHGKFYFGTDHILDSTHHLVSCKVYVYYLDIRDISETRINWIQLEWSGEKFDDQTEDIFLTRFYQELIKGVIYGKTTTDLVNPRTGKMLVFVECRELLQNGYILNSIENEKTPKD